MISKEEFSGWKQWGVQHVKSPQEKKRVALSNLLGLTTSLLLFPYTLLYLYLGWYGLAFTTTGVCCVLASTPYLNRIKYTSLSRWLLLSAWYFDIYFLLFVMGSMSGIHLTAGLLGWTPLILFGIHSLRRILISSSFAIGTYWIAHFYPFPSTLPPCSQGILHLLFTFSIFSALYLLTYQLIKTNEDNEEALIRVNQAQSNLLADMSHELRTPLNSIVGYSDLLAESFAEEDFDNQIALEDIQRIQNSAQYLVKLIDGLLDISKIESGQVEVSFESVNLFKFCKQLEELVSPLVKAQGNRFIQDIELSIPDFEIDPLKVRQCLLNLLSNAAKFTENGTITLQVFLEEPPSKKNPFSEQICFIIKDDGAGMKQSDIAKIFSPYVQLNQGITKQKGSGLGITITQKLCEIMKGTFTIESELGKGTTCTLKIPIKKHD